MYSIPHFSFTITGFPVSPFRNGLGLRGRLWRGKHRVSASHSASPGRLGPVTERLLPLSAPAPPGSQFPLPARRMGPVVARLPSLPAPAALPAPTHHGERSAGPRGNPLCAARDNGRQWEAAPLPLPVPGAPLSHPRPLTRAALPIGWRAPTRRVAGAAAHWLAGAAGLSHWPDGSVPLPPRPNQSLLSVARPRALWGVRPCPVRVSVPRTCARSPCPFPVRVPRARSPCSFLVPVPCARASGAALRGRCGRARPAHRVRVPPALHGQVPTGWQRLIATVAAAPGGRALTASGGAGEPRRGRKPGGVYPSAKINPRTSTFS